MFMPQFIPTYIGFIATKKKLHRCNTVHPHSCGVYVFVASRAAARHWFIPTRVGFILAQAKIGSGSQSLYSEQISVCASSVKIYFVSVCPIYK